MIPSEASFMVNYSMHSCKKVIINWVVQKSLGIVLSIDLSA